METDDKLNHLIKLALEMVSEQKKANLELDLALPKLEKVVNRSWISKLDELSAFIKS